MCSLDKCDKLYQQACVEGVSKLGNEEDKCLSQISPCTEIHKSLSIVEQEHVCRQLKMENLDNHRDKIGVIQEMCSRYE